MVKKNLITMAALLMAGTTAQAGNPWSDYDWAAKPASSAYQAPAYFQQQARPQVSLTPGAAAVYQTEATQTAAALSRVSHTEAGCPTGGVYAPQPSYGQQSHGHQDLNQPADTYYTPSQTYSQPTQSYSAPAQTHAAPAYTAPADSYSTPAPVYADGAGSTYAGSTYADVGSYAAPAYSDYGTCNVSYGPKRTYSSSIFAEALFLNANQGFTNQPAVTGVGGSLGPLGNTFGYDDIGDGSATGYRIGADLLFGNTCDKWLKGVGFAYTDFGSFGGSRVGAFEHGVEFIGHQKPGNHAGSACDVLTEFGQFQSFRQAVAEQNALNAGVQDFYGAGHVLNNAGDVVRNATFRADHHLDVDAIGVNFILADRCRKCQFGIGWQQLNVNSNGFVGISGLLEAGNSANADWYANNTTPISSQAFQNAGLQHIGGDDNGLDNGEWIELLSGADANNTLNGINFNARTRLFCRNGFDLVGTGNIGVYHNDVSTRVFQRYSELEGGGLSQYGRQVEGHDSVVSFAAGLGLTGGYWVTDCLRLYGGYELNWISGVALAPSQNFVGNDYHLKHNDDLLLHGAKIGVEYCY